VSSGGWLQRLQATSTHLSPASKSGMSEAADRHVRMALSALAWIFLPSKAASRENAGGTHQRATLSLDALVWPTANSPRVLQKNLDRTGTPTAQ